MIALDALDAEERYRLEPATLDTPDKLYDWRWAITVLQRAMKRLEAEVAAKAEAAQFAELKRFLSDQPQNGEYDEIARRLGMKPGSVASKVSPWRDRLGELVREEIAHTVANQADVEDELRHLRSLLGG